MDVKLSYLDKNNKRLEKECADFLESSPSAFFQQIIEWRNVIQDLGTDESVFILAKNKGKVVGLLPLYIFRSPYGNIINSIPYPGPLGGVLIKKSGPEKKEIFKTLIDGVSEIVKVKKCVLATIISSPFHKDQNLYRKFFKPDWELENYTLYIDLTKSITTTSHFRNNLKRMLKRANENGFIIQETNKLTDFASWYKVHSLRHQQIGLEPLPKKILSGILTHLTPNDKGKLFVIKKNKKIVAGCFLAYHKDIVDTYIISGDEESYKNGAIYLLIDYVIKWVKGSKFKIFNWQSSKPRGGGPYNFKMQWGSRESPYFFFTKQYGPIEKILKLGIDGVKKHYKWHFVLPYSVFEKSEKRG